MSFLYVGAAAAVVGTVGSAIGAATKDNDVKSTTKVEFPLETRQLFQTTEEPLLRSSLQAQSNILAPLFGGMRTAPQAQQQFQTGRGPALAMAAGRRGAQQGGIPNLGPLDTALQGIDPQLLAALQMLATQRGQQTRAVTPPGYGVFLSPSTISTQEGGGSSGYEQGFQIAASLGGIAGGFYKGS